MEAVTESDTEAIMKILLVQNKKWTYIGGHLTWDPLVVFH
jgi:hypothetical protein